MRRVSVLFPGLFFFTVCTMGQVLSPPSRSDDASVGYDRFKDETAISVVTSMSGFTWAIGDPSIQAYVTCQGQKQKCLAKTVTVLMSADTAEWMFGSNPRTVRIIANGRRFDLGMYQWDGRVISGGHLRESLAFVVSVGDYAAITDSEKVEIQFGGYSAEFGSQEIRRLRILNGSLEAYAPPIEPKITPPAIVKPQTLPVRQKTTKG